MARSRAPSWLSTTRSRPQRSSVAKFGASSLSLSPSVAKSGATSVVPLCHMHLHCTIRHTFVRWASTSALVARVGVATRLVVVENCGQAMKMEEGLAVAKDFA
ncbi:hypothetical protein NL676_022380 [Syzygium grande]|nr:hypothetical protein NL676_022380 [Syzygium grande]